MYNLSDFETKLKEFGVNLPKKYLSGKVAQKLHMISSELERCAKLFNLTAITEPDEVIKKHIVDCLFLALEIEKLSDGNKAKIIDIGSGAGFPSLPLAAACDAFSVTALDSTAKKIGYITETAKKIGAIDFEGIAGRAEEIAFADKRESYDFVTARAVARLSVLAELCIPFISVGGYFVAMKGAQAEEEIREAEYAIKKLGCEFISSVPYSIADLEDKRFLVIYRKISTTKSIYPRNYSQISKKPL